MIFGVIHDVSYFCLINLLSVGGVRVPVQFLDK